MKGLVLEDVKCLKWHDDVPEPVMGPRDAIIKPVAVSPCTTDLHIYKTLGIPFVKGHVLGHEMVGIVEEVGKNVKDFRPGDRVAVPTTMPEWNALGVQDGLFKFNDHSIYFSPSSGTNGVFADRFLSLNADMNISHIPDSVTWEQAIMLTDMGVTGFEAVEQAHIHYGDTVVIYGIGAVGLMALRAAYLSGAGKLIGIGSREVCFEVAKAYGATDLIDYHNGDVVDQVLECSKKPVDVVVICGGKSTALGDALDMVKPGGVVVNAAAFFEEPNLPLNYNQILMDKTIRTVIAKGGRGYMNRLLSLVEYGRLPSEKIVTHTLHGRKNIKPYLLQMDGGNRKLIKSVIYMD
jgi:threonine dehydrogenase-like Zn-dependent dehydrogenase